MGNLIPFNVPYVPEASKAYMLEALKSNHQQGDGPFTTKASKLVSDLVAGGHILLTPSCTHALEMASMLTNLGPGDEVILPSYTFTSAATAVTKFGATPIFVDIDMETKGIDVNQVRDAISPRTKAISWVNYAGVAPDVEGLQSLAQEFNLILIEDNAHGLGGSYKGKPLGSFGDFATQSFHATKNIQCGEGGALVVNNAKFIERAEIIREKGTDRSKFIRGEVQKYQWVDEGSSYLLAEILSAQLLGQLENFHQIQELRFQAWSFFSEFFENWALKPNIRPQQIPKQSANVSHIFYCETNESDLLIQKLHEIGLQVTSHYQPLGNSKYMQKARGKKFDTPNAERVAKDLVRFPIYPSLDLDKVNNLLKKVR